MVRKVTMFWTVIQISLPLLLFSLPYISDSDFNFFQVQMNVFNSEVFKYITHYNSITNNYELFSYAEIVLHICLGKVDKWVEGAVPSRTLECEK